MFLIRSCFFESAHIRKICKNAADLHISAKICKNPADLHRFAKIENLGSCLEEFETKVLASLAVIPTQMEKGMFYIFHNTSTCVMGKIILWYQIKSQTRRERLKSAPYLRLKKRKRLFLKKNFKIFFSKFYRIFFSKNQKNGLSGAPGPASASPWRAKRGTLPKLSTCLLQLKEEPFGEKTNFRKKVSQCRKTERGDPLGFLNTQCVVEGGHPKKMKGDPLERK